MQRKEKKIVDRETIDSIIQHSDICHLACCQEDIPYSIPISFGYDGEVVYIHTASAGKKIAIFEMNPRVCLTFVSQADILSHSDQACKWSFAFSSVIAEGKISEITEPEGKSTALNQIMSHYSRRDWDFPKKTLSGTRVWKITLETLTGKISPPPKN